MSLTSFRISQCAGEWNYNVVTLHMTTYQCAPNQQKLFACLHHLFAVLKHMIVVVMVYIDQKSILFFGGKIPAHKETFDAFKKNKQTKKRPTFEIPHQEQTIERPREKTTTTNKTKRKDKSLVTGGASKSCTTRGHQQAAGSARRTKLATRWSGVGKKKAPPGPTTNKLHDDKVLTKCIAY